ncbi:MAG: hypothetical protein IJ583_07205 [Firmicutes bacterium]|nr:hypothetical protein [Bacillota bacterium]
MAMGINTGINASENVNVYNIQITNHHLTKEQEEQLSSAEIKNLKKSGKVECETCKNRKYQDGSDDSGVSYQTPTNISPEESEAKVMAHEREHVVRNAAAARKEGGTAISTVTTQKAVCPECGRIYTAGGLTKTTTRTDKEKEDDKTHFAKNFFDNTVGKNQAKMRDYQI